MTFFSWLKLFKRVINARASKKYTGPDGTGAAEINDV
jgi:hypothetical protein